MSCDTGSIVNQFLVCPVVEAIDYTSIIQAFAILISGFVLLAFVVFSGQLLIEAVSGASGLLHTAYQDYLDDQFVRKQSKFVADSQLQQEISEGKYDLIDYSDPYWSDAGIKIFGSSSQIGSDSLQDDDDLTEIHLSRMGLNDPIVSANDGISSDSLYWDSDVQDSSELEYLIYDEWAG